MEGYSSKVRVCLTCCSVSRASFYVGLITCSCRARPIVLGYDLVLCEWVGMSNLKKAKVPAILCEPLACLLFPSGLIKASNQ
ncbi:uncharacterized protein P174DRAFT_440933 [Aspergillus novofumigatus IBT 16806]|uniref:Uncharacterized protein n=1 Tax=Aspergillus novofumigatus (strain IBT 16806) TaxID=1392255 RepID=A0A2I1C7Q2_ASPN1|nr:uncharacterized protein P174DRAFT_440933 [Aspergillus novofumigatus IBT 16806]PKX93668.1 hypothetical protein P174DRAFT_440933 [Aspergillus novofumigatus IBT 16806]